MKKYSLEDKKILASWAADCVERVLPFFEESFPADTRPREALRACREWVRTGVFSMAVIRAASLGAHAAAREVKGHDAAFNAARAAGQAVGTAHVPQHAFGVFYALRAVAAAFPDDAEHRVAEEYAWQAGGLPEHLRKEYLKRMKVEKRKSGLFITIVKDADF